MSRGSSSITFDPRKFLDALKTVSREAGVSMSNLIRYQMALWVKDLVKRTGTNPEWTYGEQRRRAKARIEKDIGKVFKDASLNTADWVVRGILGNEFHAFKTKTGAVYGVDGDLYWESPSLAKMREHHQKYRSATTGRVTTARGGSESGRNTKDIGRWKFVNWVHTKKSAINRLVKDRQKDIGKTKAGWLVAANRFSAAAQGIVTNMAPAWVTRHAGWAAPYGEGYEQGSWLSGTITAVAVNKVPWARDWSGMMAATLRTRQLDIQRQMIKRVDTLKKLARL